MVEWLDDLDSKSQFKDEALRTMLKSSNMSKCDLSTVLSVLDRTAEKDIDMITVLRNTELRKELLKDKKVSNEAEIDAVINSLEKGVRAIARLQGYVERMIEDKTP